MAHFADTNLVYLEFASIADAAIRTAIFNFNVKGEGKRSTGLLQWQFKQKGGKGRSHCSVEVSHWGNETTIGLGQ